MQQRAVTVFSDNRSVDYSGRKKSEMESYSSVLRETSTPAIIPHGTFKEVVQAVVKEEHRSKNIVFCEDLPKKGVGTC
jgi:hypothetical protein